MNAFSYLFTYRFKKAGYDRIDHDDGQHNNNQNPRIDHDVDQLDGGQNPLFGKL